MAKASHFVRILGYDVPINYVKGLIESEGHFGQYISSEDGGEIKIDSSLKGKQLLRVLLHEEFHAIWTMLGIEELPKDKVGESLLCIEELVVDHLSRFVVENYSIKKKPSC